ncbi:hypothetical protein IQ276_031585 [Desmonostoc muscorum LEGE 12446]|uniref:CBS domain-containing protein n=1 Tax=Desmonostoc muscorum LEGE 12446 TaxID=1828758 RepID=A0A8J6ZYI6_DESMC|nr:hypothetical protein [Desmonostoc muscorum]MCF2150887.1 hypothetical protein [Desmonostoc muscorum LEGE 12446]
MLPQILPQQSSLESMMATGGIKNANQPNLRLESTLQELPFWQVHVEIERPGNDLATLFNQEPLLPGIILNNNQEYMGMISRRKFFEHMSHPYSLSLFSLRPIGILYKFFQRDVLVLSEHMTIVQGYFILKSCLSVSSPKEHKR